MEALGAHQHVGDNWSMGVDEITAQVERVKWELKKIKNRDWRNLNWTEGQTKEQANKSTEKKQSAGRNSGRVWGPGREGGTPQKRNASQVGKTFLRPLDIPN